MCMIFLCFINKQKMVKIERNQVFVKPSGFKEVKELITKGNSLMFDVNISPKSWVLPNRARFNHWIDNTFKYEDPSLSIKEEQTKSRKQSKTKSLQEDVCNTKSDSVELFAHQKFIKDYIQFTSPYRGLMVFHNLGTGKSCTAVAAAEIMLKNSDMNHDFYS